MRFCPLQGAQNRDICRQKPNPGRNIIRVSRVRVPPPASTLCAAFAGLPRSWFFTVQPQRTPATAHSKERIQVGIATSSPPMRSVSTRCDVAPEALRSPSSTPRATASTTTPSCSPSCCATDSRDRRVTDLEQTVTTATGMGCSKRRYPVATSSPPTGGGHRFERST